MRTCFSPSVFRSPELRCPQRRGGRIDFVGLGCSAVLTTCRSDSSTARLLDRFWQAHGVADSTQRQKLIAAGQVAANTPLDKARPYDGLPGVNDIWQLDSAASTSPQVVATCQRLEQLQHLLGHEDDVDLVWMLIREPGLLAADMTHLSSRLMTMKLAAESAAVDVIKIVEAHPSLLLQQTFALDEEENVSDRVNAWQHGLVSDGELEWEKRCLQLAQYAQQQGNAHIGYRDAEDADLARWARKQRSSHRHNTLDPARALQLQKLGFELDDESAEWLKSFYEVKAYQGLMGHSCPGPLTTGSSFLLTNWCSVQRVARRSGVLPASRIALLDGIEFDWTCADALS